MATKPIPEGYRTITPGFIAKNCDKAIDFIKSVFRAEERMRFLGPDGKVAHCELQLGDCVLMCGEAGDHHAAAPQYLMVYVPDCDATFKRALDAGAKALDQPTDQFYGDRNGRVKDPFGNEWVIATHIEDVSPEEMEKRAKAAMAKASSAS
jgi:PhnB protein